MVNLTSGGMSEGYRKYLRAMVPRLRQQPGIDELRVFVPPAVRGDPEAETWISWPEAGARAQISWLERQLESFRPDVVFVPTARAFACTLAPVVVMVRNMEPLLVPWGGNPIGEGLKNTVRALGAKRACRRAARVIAVSSFVRTFLISEWNIPSEKICVVYHGIESAPPREEARKPSSYPSDSARQFLFAAGSIRPARGLEELLRAFAAVQRNLDLDLLVAGRVDPGMQSYFHRVRDLAAGLGMGSRVFWLGHLTPAEMSWCFYNCAALIVTSHAEACPNIVLEAMSHGTLSISTDQPPMPEFFQGGARYYTAGDPVSLSAAMVQTLAGSQEHRSCLQQVGRTRAADFSWETSARETARELCRAAEIGSSSHLAHAGTDSLPIL